MHECIKKIVMSIFQLAAVMTFAAEPTVSNVAAKQRYPWNGLVDITCTVTGINGITNDLYFVMSSVDSGKTNNVSHFYVVQGGVNSSDREVHTNGNYKLLWDAQKDLAEGVYSNMVVQVDLKTREKVQLWEGGPYWATTNIGAEEPEDYGYYFWWGDTIGYKRENNAWVATDGSSSNFSFDSSNTPTYGKDDTTLLNEGWIITKDSVNILAPEHDAAHIKWGGSWRMPTIQEQSDLISKCDWTWTRLHDVRGYIVRGRGDYASVSIFLPCCGLGVGTSFEYALTDGDYMSSVPGSLSYAYYYGARLLKFDLFGATTTSYLYARENGGPIRPVQGFTE